MSSWNASSPASSFPANLRLLDDAGQAPASLDGLALVLDDTVHDLNDILNELFTQRGGV